MPRLPFDSARRRRRDQRIVGADSARRGQRQLLLDQGLDERFHGRLVRELEVRKSAVKIQALCPGFTLSEFHDTSYGPQPIPQSLWMTADFVVSESLRGFDEGKLFVIPAGDTSCW